MPERTQVDDSEEKRSAFQPRRKTFRYIPAAKSKHDRTGVQRERSSLLPLPRGTLEEARGILLPVTGVRTCSMKPPVYLSRPRRNYARVLLRPRAVASKLTGTSNPVSFLSFFLSLLLRVAFACLYLFVHAREMEEENVAVLLESSFILCLTLRLICVKATFFTDKTRLDQSKHLKLESTLKLAKFSTNSPCCPFFSESPVDEGKGREGEGGREKGARKNKRVDRTCIVASADRPKSAASDGWHFGEKKLEMIDDRPILVATYGAAYPPACSRYNGRRNLFPRWPEMSRFRRHSRANFYLTTTPCYVSTHADCRTYVRAHTRSFAASVYIAHAAAFLRGGEGGLSTHQSGPRDARNGHGRKIERGARQPACTRQ